MFNAIFNFLLSNYSAYSNHNEGGSVTLSKFFHEFFVIFSFRGIWF